MIEIDGGRGEGGGQVLRSSLSLSLATGQPFRIDGIRAKRKKPGLLRQHLTAVQAATGISDAEVEGAALASASLTFRPRALRPGDYSFSVGTAGSAMLVLQTVLVPLGLTGSESTVRVTGGTHNPWAPPFDALCDSFLPQLARMGITVDAELVRHGFFPAGGGEARFHIRPADRTSLPAFELLERGEAFDPTVDIVISKIRQGVADEEAGFLGYSLDWPEDRFRTVVVKDSPGPGNVVTIRLPFEHVTEVVTAFGEKRLTARRVAKQAARDVRRYLSSKAPVGEHLADQLLVPLALLRGGSFRAQTISPHTSTNIEVLNAFLSSPVTVEDSEVPSEALVHVRA